MMIATQITLLIMACLSFLAFIGSKTEKSGYLFLVGTVVMLVLLLVTFNFYGY